VARKADKETFGGAALRLEPTFFLNYQAPRNVVPYWSSFPSFPSSMGKNQQVSKMPAFVYDHFATLTKVKYRYITTNKM
jgi:hypothetical protein